MPIPVSERVAVAGRNEPVSGYVRLGFRSEQLACSIAPGQFVNIACGDPRAMFLPRPFSLHRWLRDDCGNRVGIEILFHVKGRGTRWLAGLHPGDTVGLAGPLGIGFQLESDMSRAALIVAGGIGVAPMPALVERLLELSRNVVALIGARSDRGLLCEDELRALGAEVEVSTEDGSRGRQGLVSHLFEEKLVQGKPMVYACGPGPMLAAVAQRATAHDVPCQLSLESVMACGVGACMGCVVPTSDGSNRRVCVEGPVFDARVIDWPLYVETVRRAGL